MAELVDRVGEVIEDSRYKVMNIFGDDTTKLIEVNS